MPDQAELDEAEIRQRLNLLVDAIQAKDLEALRQLYAADVVSFDVEAPLQHLGVEAKLANWARAFLAFQDVAYEVRHLSVAVSDGLAFGHCFARLHGTLQSGAATRGMWVRGTFCFRKIGGNWLIVHDHASVPLDLQTGEGVTNLAPVG
jgi:ketosteroid isomerase-like protein